MERSALNTIIERTKLTIVRQEKTLRATLELIELVGISAKLGQQRNRQQQALNESRKLLETLEAAVKASKSTK